MPKQKPEELLIAYLMKISPTEKAAWKAHAQKLGLPLATFIKSEINKIVFGEPFDYGAIIEPFLQFNSDILATCVVDMSDGGNVLYATNTWGPTTDCIPIVQQWTDESASDDPILLFGTKYTLLRKSPEYLFAKDLENKQWLIGTRQNSNAIFLLVIVSKQGNPMVAYTDLWRVVDKINQSARVEDVSDMLDISSEISQVAYQDIPARERRKMLKERQEEKRQELEKIKSALSATVMQEIVDFQARTYAEEATGMPLTSLYNYLAEHFDLARFEIDDILANNAYRVVYPSETTMYVQILEE